MLTRCTLAYEVMSRGQNRPHGAVRLARVSRLVHRREADIRAN